MSDPFDFFQQIAFPREAYDAFSVISPIEHFRAEHIGEAKQVSDRNFAALASPAPATIGRHPITPSGERPRFSQVPMNASRTDATETHASYSGSGNRRLGCSPADRETLRSSHRLLTRGAERASWRMPDLRQGSCAMSSDGNS